MHAPGQVRRPAKFFEWAFACLLLNGAGAPEGVALAQAPPAGTPVLVELFTSEGCSSCPPADRLLARLAAEQSVPGARVVPVSFHVDYWDRLGWKDAYSSAAFTERQGAYAARLGNAGRVYTPQMIVDGRKELVGSDERAARRAIEAAAKEPAALVRVVPDGDGEFRVTAVGASGPADVLLAVTEDPPASDVTRGENAGRKLTHVAVARELRILGAVDERGRFDGRARVAPPPPALGPRRVIAFAQDRASGRVLGVSTPLALSSIR